MDALPSKARYGRDVVVANASPGGNVGSAIAASMGNMIVPVAISFQAPGALRSSVGLVCGQVANALLEGY